jgi:hypothetical protein
LEITPLQRRVTFGLIVFVLVALGAYLIGPLTHSSGSPQPRRSAPPHPASGATASLGIPAPTPAATAPPGRARSPDIYQWLPFTQAELGAASARVRQFGDAYGTFSYTETAAAYAATLAPLSSAALAAQIKAAYQLPGVAAARSSAHQVSTGSTLIQSLRAYGAGSLTFVVQITENMTTESGRKQQVTSYAITLTGAGSGWQVTDIELASAGNS